MIAEIRDFLNRERGYSLLLIGILVFYSFFLILSEKEEYTPSPAMEKIKTVQASFESHRDEQDYLAKFFNENKDSALVAAGSFIMFILFIIIGFIMSVVFFVQRIHGRSLLERVSDGATVAWGVGDIAKIIILFISISIITGIGFGSINDAFFHDQHKNLFIILHTTVTDIAILCFIMYFIVIKYKASIKTIGLNGAHVIKDMIIGGISYSMILPYLLAVIVLLSIIMQMIQFEPPPHPLVDIFLIEDRQSPFLIGFSIVLACVIGPFIEEIFFRGFCYNAIKKKWGVRAAMIVTASFFAFIHQSTFSFIPIFFLGFILAYLYEKRGTLIPSITLHIVHNSLFIGYFFLLKRCVIDRIG
ncbi:MAG: CPBP family intramembrane metalloprotease [Candidatus Omnitrophica bacterium]|nr:CPBP family intramembrane metalloprotease [Candidatus Omnitrophota bacterium]